MANVYSCRTTTIITWILHFFISSSATAFVLQQQQPPPSLQLRQKALTLPTPALFAKKKKGNKSKSKKGGGDNKQKKSGFEWATSFTLKPFEAKATRELASTAVASFEGRTGKPLCEDLKGVADVPKALWNASLACVVVGPAVQAVASNGGEEDDEESVKDVKPTEPTESVVVKYANAAALETVGLKPDEFERFIVPTGPEDGAKPIEDCVSILLSPVMKGEKKYEGGYKKKIMKSTDEGDGQDITILNAHRWAIEKSALIDGKFTTTTIGVAYAWEEWVAGEDTLCAPGGKRKTYVLPAKLEEAVQAQAAVIRELKEGQGLGNKDPEVANAVEELLRLKALLTAASG